MPTNSTSAKLSGATQRHLPQAGLEDHAKDKCVDASMSSGVKNDHASPSTEPR